VFVIASKHQTKVEVIGSETL
jgi:hypothetical protein